MNKVGNINSKQIQWVEEYLYEYHRSAMILDREIIYGAMQDAYKDYIKTWGFDTVKRWIQEGGPDGEEVYFKEILQNAMEDILGYEREDYDD